MSAFFNWGANFLASATFLTLIDGIGETFEFWIFACFVFACFVFACFVFACFAVVAIVVTYALVPETKNKLLERIEDYWRNRRSWATTKRNACAEL